MSVNVFRFLILWVKKYILGRSRPERQAPGQSSALVVSVQGRPQFQLQDFIMQPPGLGTERSQVSPDAEARWGQSLCPGPGAAPKGEGPPRPASLSPLCWGSPYPHPPPPKPQPPLLGVSLPPPGPHPASLSPLCWGSSPPHPSPHEPQSPVLGGLPSPTPHPTSLSPLC